MMSALNLFSSVLVLDVRCFLEIQTESEVCLLNSCVK